MKKIKKNITLLSFMWAILLIGEIQEETSLIIPEGIFENNDSFEHVLHYLESNTKMSMGSELGKELILPN